MTNRSVSVVTNVKEGVRVATALEASGLLDRLVSLPVWNSESEIDEMRVPRALRRDLAIKRVMPSPRRDAHSRAYLPEAARLAVRRVVRNNYSRALNVADILYDAHARKLVRADGCLHFMAGIGARAAERMSELGGVSVCHRRSLHHEDEAEVVRKGVDGPYTHPEDRLKTRFEREFAASSYVLCNSQLTATSLRNHGVSVDKLHVIHAAVDTSFFAPSSAAGTEADDGNRPLRVLFVGSIDYRKGADIIARAAKLLGPAVEFRMAGPVQDARVARALRQAGNTTNLGVLSPVALRAEYQYVDVTILPSRADAFGYSIAESLSCATPVVVSRSSGSAEVVRDGVTGLVMEDVTAESLATQLEVLRQADKREQMGQELLQYREELGWSRYADELEHFYKTRVPAL